jgi:hypothetical protein
MLKKPSKTAMSQNLVRTFPVAPDAISRFRVASRFMSRGDFMKRFCDTAPMSGQNIPTNRDFC